VQRPAIDATGREMLHGLSADESQFFVERTREMPSKVAELDRYAALSRRHESRALEDRIGG
jgi:hypothetical protein